MSDLIEVHATAKRYRALTHVPSGEGFDEHGNGLWPNDSFTHRLVGEGALKLGHPASAKAEDAPAKAATSSKGA